MVLSIRMTQKRVSVLVLLCLLFFCSCSGWVLCGSYRCGKDGGRGFLGASRLGPCCGSHDDCGNFDIARRTR